MESNLFLTNDNLKKELEGMKKELDELLVKLDIKEKELIKLREQENAKKEFVKTYAKTYFQEKTKNRVRHCSCCNMDIKSSSYCNHIKSKVHFQNENKQKEIKE